MRFGLLDRYLFRTAAITAVICLVGLTAVIWITSALRELDLVTGKGQTLLVFLQFTLLSLPALVIVIAPVAVFVATLYTLNKLNGDSELIVMSAAGVAPGRLLKPFLVLALVTTLLVGAMTVWLMPAAFRDLRDMITRIRADFVANIVKEGQFTDLEQGVTFHYRERSGDALLGIFFQDRRDPEKPTVYLAERGITAEVEGRPLLVLEKGSVQQQDARNQDSTIVTFERYAVDLASLTGEEGAITYKPRERSTLALLMPDKDEAFYQSIKGRFRAELHDRFIAPLYVLAFMMIAFAALSEPKTTRQGRGAAVAAAILAAAALRIAGFGAASAMVRGSLAVYAGYGFPLATIAICLMAIFWRRRLDAVLAPVVQLAAALRGRLAAGERAAA